MPFSHAPIGILLASLLLAGLPSTTAMAQQANPISVGNDLIEKLRIELNKKLNQTVEVKFEGVPLREAVTDIVDQIQADVVFADTEIEEEGLTTENPVTRVLEHTKLPARAALDLLLEPAGLTAINRDGILWVTTAERAEEIFSVRVYDVRDLVDDFAKTLEPLFESPCECPEIHDDVEENCVEKSSKNNSATTGDLSEGEYGESMIPHFFDYTPTDCLQWYGGTRGLANAAVIHAISSEATGPWAKFSGKGGQVRLFDGQLIITQTEENHAQIQKILDELRSNKDTPDHEQEAVEEKDTSHQPVASPLPTY